MATNTYLVADLFCGAGGSSTSAKQAIADIGGTMELVAINHWNTAIATHAANHPTARHLVEDVSMVDPEAVVEEGRLDLLMASPECTFYSRARGGKPVHDQGRMNPWAIHNWLTKLDVNCVLIENVPEFVEWGPLDPDGRPDKKRQGEHFQARFLTFQALGYKAEWRMLNAADYGDATTRKRFFLMARKDGKLITWPEPSHAKGATGMFPGRLPWRGAKEIIDWSNTGRSLLDDPKYRKKPLSVKTRRRIARGLERFGGPLAPLYIRLLDLPGDSPPTPAKTNGQVSSPFILNRGSENGSSLTHAVEGPLHYSKRINFECTIPLPSRPVRKPTAPKSKNKVKQPNRDRNRSQRPDPKQSVRDYQKKRRQRAKELGKCKDCFQPAIPGQIRCPSCAAKNRQQNKNATAKRQAARTAAQTGGSKEHAFESTLVIARKPRRKPKAGAPQSKEANSPAPTANTRKGKTAKASVNGETTTVQADNPKDKIFKLVAQVPGQVKKASKPRKRKAPRRPSNTEQRTLPDLPGSGGESKA